MSKATRPAALLALTLTATGCAAVLGLDSGHDMADDAGPDVDGNSSSSAATSADGRDAGGSAFADDAGAIDDASKAESSTLTCASGTADCNGNLKDGCETSLNDPMHCGSCTTKCPPMSACMAEVCCLTGHAACTNDSDCCSGNCGDGKTGCR
jgi:hypothetical protein